ncbi:MAG: dihydropteroate synthase-like protein [Methanosarcinales archaeon]|nr:dihydropteroate synthase-like protein [Methanosarcinales archaeon]
MQVLVVTGRKAAGIVRRSVGNLAEVLVLDINVAAFTTPTRLERFLAGQEFDLIIIPGLVSADFSGLERQLETPIRLGPKHAVDLGFVLSSYGDVELSTTVPACELLMQQRRDIALSSLAKMENAASPALVLSHLKIGGDSTIKVMAEIVDATALPGDELIERIHIFQSKGADIIDLGVGMAATAGDVRRTVKAAREVVSVPLSIDTLEPELIVAAVGSGVDMVLSLNSGNIPQVAPVISQMDIAAVIIPDSDGGMDSLEANIKSAKDAGISKIIADPVLDPPGQGMVESMTRYKQFRRSHPRIPTFFGVGNITELIDADSVGVNAMLASIAGDVGADILFTPEYSDKARGSIAELKTAAGMTALAGRRSTPPKDLGLDLLVLKEKRFRPFDNLPEDFIEGEKSYQWMRDPAGSFRISISDQCFRDGEFGQGRIIARHAKYTIVGDNAKEVLDTALDLGLVSRLDHAAYLGSELMKAELAIKLGRSYSQDDDF